MIASNGPAAAFRGFTCKFSFLYFSVVHSQLMRAILSKMVQKRKPRLAPGPFGNMRNRSKHTVHSRIPASAIRSIETAIEEQFFHRASALLKDPAWASYTTHGIHGPKLAIGEFTERYTALLAWAFIEYVDLLWRALTASSVRIRWPEAEECAFHFVERFVTDSYHHPWNGDFLRQRQEYRQEYKRYHESAPSWFGEWPTWERIFPNEVRSGFWKQQAVEGAKQRVQLLVTTAMPARGNRRPPAPGEGEVPIPRQWNDLLSKGSISQTHTAQLLRCNERTVRRLADRHELKKSDVGRIVCDEQLRHQIRKKHGEHVLR